MLIILRHPIKGFYRFLKECHLDKILLFIILIIVFSSIFITTLEPLNLNIIDSFWFVITSITTVGYGDITPITTESKILTMILVIIGFLTISILTGSISAAYSNRVVINEGSKGEEKLREEIKEIVKQGTQGEESLKQEIKEIVKQGTQGEESFKDEIKDLNDKIDALTKVVENNSNNSQNNDVESLKEEMNNINNKIDTLTKIIEDLKDN